MPHRRLSHADGEQRHASVARRDGTEAMLNLGDRRRWAREDAGTVACRCRRQRRDERDLPAVTRHRQRCRDDSTEPRSRTPAREEGRGRDVATGGRPAPPAIAAEISSVAPAPTSAPRAVARRVVFVVVFRRYDRVIDPRPRAQAAEGGARQAASASTRAISRPRARARRPPRLAAAAASRLPTWAAPEARSSAVATVLREGARARGRRARAVVVAGNLHHELHLLRAGATPAAARRRV